MGRRRWSNSGVGVERATHLYKFEEGSPTLIDSQGLTNGDIISNPLIVSGVNGNALKFDGVDDYVLFPNNLGLNTLPFSITYNVKKTNASDRLRTISGSDNGNYRGVSIEIDSTTIYVHYYSGGLSPSGRKTFFSSQGVNDTNWHKIAVEFIDFNTVKVYVDSVDFPMSFHSGNGTAVTLNGCFYKLMLEASITIYGACAMDNLRIYSDSLLEESEK